MKNRSCLSLFILLLFLSSLKAQDNWDTAIQRKLPEVLQTHRYFVSLPNVAANAEDMYRNIDWVTEAFEQRDFQVSLLESSTLPVFFAERTVDPKAKTILYYFHLDGQAVNPERWDQPDPFVPVLKAQNAAGDWEIIDWSRLKEEIDPEWRVYGRAAADDKAPIMMFLTALDLLSEEGKGPHYNLKVVLDPQEEAGSEAFLSTLEKYKQTYAADYMLILDGPAHASNLPTLTFGCRGIATCNITTYGAKLPQHSGHYGNYAPNPIFTMSHLLASMKDDHGRVLIEGYYDGIDIDPQTARVLAGVPDDEQAIRRGLLINQPDQVGAGYQEALQYPSLNVRHIETSWKGPGLKTVIPEFVTAHLDVRLVAETDGKKQLEKIKKHVEGQGFLVLDRAPTNAERLQYRKIVKFVSDPGVNAFRTNMNAGIGHILSQSLAKAFGEEPVKIRSMGGTVPIIEAVQVLDIPAVIVPTVNMDNNQHNPNENIRIGNISQGIKMCMVMLTTELEE